MPSQWFGFGVAVGVVGSAVALFPEVTVWLFFRAVVFAGILLFSVVFTVCIDDARDSEEG